MAQRACLVSAPFVSLLASVSGTTNLTTWQADKQLTGSHAEALFIVSMAAALDPAHWRVTRFCSEILVVS